MTSAGLAGGHDAGHRDVVGQRVDLLADAHADLAHQLGRVAPTAAPAAPSRAVAGVGGHRGEDGQPRVLLAGELRGRAQRRGAVL